MRLRLLCYFLLTGIAVHAQQWHSKHVERRPDGSLRYVADAKGNTIPGFSRVGYHAQDEEIPLVPTVKILSPVPGDNLAHIQSALDELARLPKNERGLRGALLLKEGTYPVSGTIRLMADGIVLRGEGEGTRIVATGKGKRNLVSVGGTGSRKELPGSRKKVTDDYVPAGAVKLRLSSVEGLKKGDRIILLRPGTKEWISALRMDRIESRDTTTKQWTPAEYDLHFERTITAIEGNSIQLDNPVMMPLEKRFGGAMIYRYEFEGRIQEVGVENLSCVSEYAHPTDEDHAWTAVYVNRAENGWVRNITARHFGFSCVDLGHLSRNITVEYCRSQQPVSQVTGGRRYSFNNDGQCNLVQHCFASEGRHDYVTGARVCGPNVFFHCVSADARADIGPHHRWAVGTLYDNIITDGEINIQDRGNWGTGHGWAGVTQVLWNCTAAKAAVQNPWASGYNYSIGLQGAQYEGRLKGRPNGEWEGRNRPGLDPASLFLAQKRERAAKEYGIEKEVPPVLEKEVKKDAAIVLKEHEGKDGSAALKKQVEKEVSFVLKEQVEKDVAWALQQEPVTITAFPAARSAGSPHDFFSEGDYWWPDPASPDSPYIRKDGFSNPGNFTAHRETMIRFSKIMGSLASAYKLDPRREYVLHAIRHARAWFTDSATYMNPSLLYAQAIKGRVAGRGIGIIDAIHLMEVAQALYAMREDPAMNMEMYFSFQSWFARYLKWLTTHPYGLDEMNAGNNHGTCWVMQAAVFARFTGNTEVMSFCSNRYKEVLLPGQMAPDGSFPLELKRTKPYGYSIFNLDAMATICHVLSSPGNDLWSYTVKEGRNIRKGIEFLYPFVQDKNTWPFPRDVMYWQSWPVAQPFLLFGANAFGSRSWLECWKRLEHAPEEKEVIRNLPVRHPLIWL